MSAGPVSYHRRITDRPRRRFPLLWRTAEVIAYVPVIWWLVSKWVDAGGVQ